MTASSARTKAAFSINRNESKESMNENQFQ